VCFWDKKEKEVKMIRDGDDIGGCDIMRRRA
jgi:hypothetical protein